MLEGMNYGGREDPDPRVLHKRSLVHLRRCSAEMEPFRTRGLWGASSGLERDVCSSFKLNNALITLRRISSSVSVH